MFIEIEYPENVSSGGAKCAGRSPQARHAPKTFRSYGARTSRALSYYKHFTPTEFVSRALSYYKHFTPTEFVSSAYKVALNFLLFTFYFFLLSCAPIFAQGWAQAPPPASSEDPAAGKVRLLENVGIDQRLGEPIPLDLQFRDESGATVRLGDFFGKRPVVLALVYYSCPMLCNQVLNGLTSGLDVVSFDIGKEFEVVTVSFDPREGPDLARNKKDTYIQWYKRPGAADGWHFLTGDKASIEKLTDAVGFHYKYDPVTNQFIHASGIMIATGEGKLSRYFYGIEYAPKDLRLGLVEASGNKIGSPVDRLLLYCYHYDPAAGKYSAVAMNILKLAAIATMVGLTAMLLLLRRRRPAEKLVEPGGVI